MGKKKMIKMHTLSTAPLCGYYYIIAIFGRKTLLFQIATQYIFFLKIRIYPIRMVGKEDEPLAKPLIGIVLNVRSLESRKKCEDYQSLF